MEKYDLEKSVNDLSANVQLLMQGETIEASYLAMLYGLATVVIASNNCRNDANHMIKNIGIDLTRVVDDNWKKGKAQIAAQAAQQGHKAGRA